MVPPPRHPNSHPLWLSFALVNPHQCLLLWNWENLCPCDPPISKSTQSNWQRHRGCVKQGAGKMWHSRPLLRSSSSAWLRAEVALHALTSTKLLLWRPSERTPAPAVAVWTEELLCDFQKPIVSHSGKCGSVCSLWFFGKAVWLTKQTRCWVVLKIKSSQLIWRIPLPIKMREDESFTAGHGERPYFTHYCRTTHSEMIIMFSP